MMKAWHVGASPNTDPLWGKSTPHEWLPSQMTFNAELWQFCWCWPEQSIEQSVMLPDLESCLSLEAVSSIPAGSTIIYRFLCGFICVSLCQSIKIKNQQICMYVCVCMYICMCVYMYICVRIYVLCVCIRICLCTYMLHSASMSQIHRTLKIARP